MFRTGFCPSSGV